MSSDDSWPPPPSDFVPIGDDQSLLPDEQIPAKGGIVLGVFAFFLVHGVAFFLFLGWVATHIRGFSLSLGLQFFGLVCLVSMIPAIPPAWIAIARRRQLHWWWLSLAGIPWAILCLEAASAILVILS